MTQILLATLDNTGNVPADQLGNAPGGGGGGGGGSSTLAGDTDVTITSPAANQGLIYNGTRWVNAALVNSFQGRTGIVTLTKTDITGTGLAAADVGADASGAATTAAAAVKGLPLGLTGATAATRFVGATTSGAPASGAFLKGDWIIDQTASLWVCTTAGSPGTWTQITGSGTTGVSSFQTRTGAVTLTKADVTGTGLAASDISAAPLASPTFTGTVTIPTASTGDSTTKAASTAFVAANAAPLVEVVNTVATSGAAQTFPDPAIKSENDITLTANCTFTFPTATSGKSFTALIRQDATGSRTITWPTLKWASGIIPAASTAASAVDIYTFVCIAGTWYGSMAGRGYA